MYEFVGLMLPKANLISYAYYQGAMVSLLATGATVVCVLTVVCGAIVSLDDFKAVLVLDENLTDGCEVDELSFVQAVKQIAMVKAAKESLVIFFTFVLFNITTRVINYKYSVFVFYLYKIRMFFVFLFLSY